MDQTIVLVNESDLGGENGQVDLSKVAVNSGDEVKLAQSDHLAKDPGFTSMELISSSLYGALVKQNSVNQTKYSIFTCN